ncbi:connectin-like [Plodia interpunctella]|uniref:connectin-like n=1 Tax=Plodia interpunctella TaxID=58824 RepID=UPI002367E9A2|nr:connectin-like [Plodia interpunctella]XP_053608671.1 connectin-like [Plodia interpunctella]XP_053608673.1 connectin-like [Plodia interpunctella]
MNLKYLILMIAATIEINVTESRQNDKRRWKNDKNYSHYVNICDIQDRVSKVHCYCESIKIKSATKADCWVFNGGIAEDDPFWSNFYSQPKIEKLSFNVRADGGLTYIPAKVIIRLERLQYLHIQYAKIFSIPSFAFTNSTTLREVILPKNKITKLETMSFAHLIMLSNVSLVENQITELKRDVFYVLPNLQRLYLSKNTISVLHDGCFKHLNNLIKLDLDNNLLTVVIRENFQGLSNLISLDMRSNKLKMIGDLAFAELWSLEELYLDGNEIEFISDRGFGGLAGLRKLSLADNKLATLDEGVLDEIVKLNVLDLRNNYLETLRQEAVQNVLENMKTHYALISLDGNRLTCDCRLSWLHKLRNETRSKRLKASLSRLNCIMDSKTKINLGILKVEKIETPLSINTIKKDYDDLDENLDEDNNYDETMQDQETETDESKIEYRRKLLEIPKDMLPCPNRLSYEASYAPPTQDEVKYYKTSSSFKSLVPINWIVLIILAKIL